MPGINYDWASKCNIVQDFVHVRSARETVSDGAFPTLFAPGKHLRSATSAMNAAMETCSCWQRDGPAGLSGRCLSAGPLRPNTPHVQQTFAPQQRQRSAARQRSRQMRHQTHSRRCATVCAAVAGSCSSSPGRIDSAGGDGSGAEDPPEVAFFRIHADV